MHICNIKDSLRRGGIGIALNIQYVAAAISTSILSDLKSWLCQKCWLDSVARYSSILLISQSCRSHLALQSTSCQLPSFNGNSRFLIMTRRVVRLASRELCVLVHWYISSDCLYQLLMRYAKILRLSLCKIGCCKRQTLVSTFDKAKT